MVKTMVLTALVNIDSAAVNTILSVLTLGMLSLLPDDTVKQQADTT